LSATTKGRYGDVRMNRVTLVALCLLALFVVGPVPSVSANSTSSAAAYAQPTSEVLDVGKKAYRQFCGQCHALKEARAVGFGSAKQKGVGEDGGPSFNQLKVSYQMCLASVTMLFGGHEKVVRKMTWQQIKDVSKFVQYSTRDHPIVARFSDG
jgi:mono/diheme cytochrome c family protein